MSHKYYTQVQGQLLVSQKKYCDFVVWTLKGQVVHRLYIPKYKFYGEAVGKIDKFLCAKLYSSVTQTLE